MFNKIKSSLILQSSFIFFISFIVIIILWIFFYFQQKYQHLEFDKARYFNTVSSLQKSLYEKGFLSDKELLPFSMRVYKGIVPKNYEIVLKRGDEKRAFEIISFSSKQLVYMYNQKASIVLEDISSHRSMVVIHLVFLVLLITQALLYMKLQKSLNPLAIINKKLKKLERGDLSPLKMQSDYDEIKQIINSYNDSISKIEHMLETREMFNKIFMHEMKMPLAKGMFYLKQTPSQKSHERLEKILKTLNEELEEFSKIESLIANQSSIDKTKYNAYELIKIAKSRHFEEKSDIKILGDLKKEILGDKEFWILCFKNLIDNALKYSFDKKLEINLCKDYIEFSNLGEDLPVDISKNIQKWKIDKNKRHKSSTGYGFGLFIVKSIVTLHNYTLEYNYDKENKKINLKVK